jgi:hypothetical protein
MRNGVRFKVDLRNFTVRFGRRFVPRAVHTRVSIGLYSFRKVLRRRSFGSVEGTRSARSKARRSSSFGRNRPALSLHAQSPLRSGATVAVLPRLQHSLVCGPPLLHPTCPPLPNALQSQYNDYLLGKMTAAVPV